MKKHSALMSPNRTQPNCSGGYQSSQPNSTRAATTNVPGSRQQVFGVGTTRRQTGLQTGTAETRSP
jgi:hypothetical protein